MDPVKIMFISNGKGEDSIAATMINALRQVGSEEQEPEIKIKALPLVGNGRGYERTGADIVANWKELPSGGFGGQKLSSLFKDISAGLLHITKDQISVLQNESSTVHLIVCVGDLYPVALAGFFTGKPIIHVATAISAYFHKYTFAERWFFKRFCKLVITRDQVTADFLARRKVPSMYFGNAMMDDPVLATDKIEYAFGDKRILTLVPSSREDAYDNTIRMLKVVQEVGKKNSIAWLLSLAPNLVMEKMKEAIAPLGWKYEAEPADAHGHIGSFSKTGCEPVHIVRGHFGDTVRSSTVVLGMTGTGNEQVAGLGKPIFLLKGKGSNSTTQRIVQYRKLLGNVIQIGWGSNRKIARDLMSLVNDPKKLKQIGEEGRERMGLPGGAYGMARAIFSEAMKNYHA